MGMLIRNKNHMRGCKKKALKCNSYPPSGYRAYRAGVFYWRGGEGAHGPICLTHWVLHQLPSEKRILRMKNVSRPPCQAVETLKYCFGGVHMHTHTCSLGTIVNKNDFLRNWKTIFSFKTCLIKLPNNNILKKRTSTKQEKTNIHNTLSHKQHCHPSD